MRAISNIDTAPAALDILTGRQRHVTLAYQNGHRADKITRPVSRPLGLEQIEEPWILPHMQNRPNDYRPTVFDAETRTGPKRIKKQRDWPYVVVTLIAMAAVGVLLAWRG